MQGVAAPPVQCGPSQASNVRPSDPAAHVVSQRARGARLPSCLGPLRKLAASQASADRVCVRPSWLVCMLAQCVYVYVCL